MLTPKTKNCMMSTREGDVLERIVFVMHGRCYPVIAAATVATCLGYTLRSINNLCDTGKLIAIFAFGHWWVAENAVMAWPNRVRWTDCVMVISS